MADKFELNDTTPAAPGGRVNVLWQSDVNGNVSANVSPGSSITIQDEGSALTQRAILNFAGIGVTVTDDAINSRTVITIPGGGSQTPWLTDVDAAGFSLSNAASVMSQGFLVQNPAVPSGLEISAADGESYIWAYDNVPILFGTNNLERIRITETGAVDVLGDINMASSKLLGPSNITIGESVSRSIRLSALGPASDPSLTVVNGVALFWTAITASIEFGLIPGFPFSAWIQVSDKLGAGGSAYPLALNPLGGNVGIGKINPSHKLDIAGDCNLSAGSVYRINGVAVGQTPWTSDIDGANHSLSNVRDIAANRFVNIADSVGSGTGVRFYNAFGGAIIQAGGLDTLQIEASGRVVIEGRVWVTTGGNVGIGTSSPGYKLDIAGDCNLSAGSVYRINGVAISTSQTPWTQHIDAQGWQLQNVGKVTFPVGTELVGFANDTYLTHQGDGDLYIIAVKNYPIRFYTNNAQRLTIAANGNVGINNPSPGSRLSVVGLPTSASGLSSGDIWRDSAAGNVLKIVP